MVFTTPKRTCSRALLAVSALLTVGPLTACSDDSSESSLSESQFNQALEYAQCMRDNGMADFPDPEEADGGLELPAGADLHDPDFQAAETACREQKPQAEEDPDGGPTLDPERVAQWAECMRENGLPDFPDPEIDGGALRLDPGAAAQSDPAFQAATQACESVAPSGSMMIGQS